VPSVPGSALLPRLVSELVASSGVAKVLLHPVRGVERLVAAGRPHVALWEGEEVDVVVIAGDRPDIVAAHLAAGRRVLATSAQHEVLDAVRPVPGSIAGIGVSPGLSSLLVVHAAALFDNVQEIRVFVVDDTSPSLLPWNTSWSAELVWFPDPIGARDVVEVASAESELLAARFGSDVKILCGEALVRPSRLLRLGRNSPQGAVLVEVRGVRGGEQHSVTYALIDDLEAAVATVLAVCTVIVPENSAAATLLELEPLPLLRELARRGVKVATPSPLH
jgi:hypothetical protein